MQVAAATNEPNTRIFISPRLPPTTSAIPRRSKMWHGKHHQYRSKEGGVVACCLRRQ